MIVIKQFFNITTKSKHTYSLLLTGYSKIYDWVFKNKVKYVQKLKVAIINLKLRFEGKSPVNFKQNLLSNDFHEIQRIKSNLKINATQSLCNLYFKTKEKYSASYSLKNIQTALVKQILKFQNKFNSNTIPKQKATMTLIQFYKIGDWFWKNSSTKTEKYTFGDMSGKTLEDMFYKSK